MADKRSMANRKHTLRDDDGKYRTTFDVLCTCGCTNGDHGAVRTQVDGKPYQPCQGCVGCWAFKRAKNQDR